MRHNETTMASDATTLDFLTKHFLVLSLALALIASGISMLFLAVYLSVFDWSLIWLIEYSDLTKFFLLGAALFLTVVVIGANLIHTFVVLTMDTRKNQIIWGSILGSVLLSLFAFPIYRDFQRGLYPPSFHVYLLFSALMGVAVLIRFSRSTGRSFGWRAFATDIAVLAFSISVFGNTFGYYVRDQSSNLQDVSTKDATYTGAKIIMMLSHHIAFVAQGHIIVLPSADITKIVANPASTEPHP
jgi:hypothetical protein